MAYHMKRAAAFAVAALALTGCGTAPTTSAEPESFETVQTGTFRPADQAQFVDCVFDGFLGSQNSAMATHVRQVKRASGWRIDVIAAAFQYVVADVGDDGQYKVTRSTYAKVLNFDKEQIASKACLQRFGAVTFDTPLKEKPGYGQGHYNAPLLR